ncbi:MAG: hypothetical protein WAW31_06470 [Smithella sp.]
MNDLEIRRMYLSDDEWERTSPSWKAMKPHRNFNEFKVTDESAQGCYERLKNSFDIPFDVIDQWLFPHYFNSNSVNNYGWIDYSKCIFDKVLLNIGSLVSLNVIEKYKAYVQMRESSQPFKEFMCIPKDIEHWKVQCTWRVPPIVIDVQSFHNIPVYSEITGHLQLVEGHSRLGYLLAMHRSGILNKESHEVYILRPKN